MTESETHWSHEQVSLVAEVIHYAISGGESSWKERFVDDINGLGMRMQEVETVIDSAVGFARSFPYKTR